jgi:hypothetical protein
MRLLIIITVLLFASTSIVLPAESFVFDPTESNNDSQLAHEKYVVRDSETILLAGQVIPPKDYIHLYDATPYKILNGHIAVKIPCDESSQPKLNVLVGQAPNLQSISLVLIEELSKPGKLCLYHADLEETSTIRHETPDIRIGTITDVALQNPGISSIEFPPTSSIVIGVNEIQPGAEESHH